MKSNFGQNKTQIGPRRQESGLEWPGLVAAKQTCKIRFKLKHFQAGPWTMATQTQGGETRSVSRAQTAGTSDNTELPGFVRGVKCGDSDPRP